MAAREQVGFVEQHVEKIVLTVAGVALVAVAVVWLPASPRTYTLAGDGQRYAPAELDGAVSRQAEKLQAIQHQPIPKDPAPPNIPEVIRASRANSCPLSPVDDYTQLTSGIWPLEPTGTSTRGTLKLADLQPLAVPQKALVQIEREVQMVQPPPPAGAAAGAAATPKPLEVVAAHGAGVFEHGKMLEKWRAALEKSTIPATFAVLAVEVQRREMSPGSSWGGPTQAVWLRDPPLPELPVFDGKNLEDVRLFMQELMRQDVQEEIIEPYYPDIIWPDLSLGSWQIHKPKTPVSDQGETPATPGVQPLRPPLVGPPMYTPSRYTPPVVPSRRTPGRDPNDYTGPSPEEMRRMEEYMRRYTTPGGGGPSVGPTSRPRVPVRPPGNIPPSPLPPRVPRVPMPPPVGPLAPIAPVAPAAPAAPVPVVVPPLASQLDAGAVEVWFHDTTGLGEGLTYSYRYRLVLYNPLFGRFGDVADEADAKALTLTTPWSDWSAAVAVKRPIEWFVVGHDATVRQSAQVEVYTLKMGRRVKHSFNVSRGEPIGGAVKVELLPLGGGAPETVSVNFSTGAVAVDFDFEKRQRVPNAAITRTTTELLYLDADGLLRTRTESDDFAAQRRKDLDLEVQQGLSAAKAGAGGVYRPY